MTGRTWMFGLMLLGLVYANFVPADASAKPPDKPVARVGQGGNAEKPGTHGSLSIGLDLFSGKLSVRVQLNNTNQECEQAPCLDGFYPCLFEYIRKLIEDAWDRHREMLNQTMPLGTAPLDSI